MYELYFSISLFKDSFVQNKRENYQMQKNKYIYIYIIGVLYLFSFYKNLIFLVIL